jgi:hypothetical protein
MGHLTLTLSPERRGEEGGARASAKGAVTGRQIDLPRKPEWFREVTVPWPKAET